MNSEKKNSVLIVDDMPQNVKMLMNMLRPAYKVYSANNGKEAIKMVNICMPDIILLEIVIPVMDGYEVLAALKNSEITKNIPVIFITGIKDDIDEQKGLSLGAADYITKPFYIYNVMFRVQRLIKTTEQDNKMRRFLLCL
jgi:PleD family two-component response regulator